MQTDTPDLVSEFETQKQSAAPDLVSEFEQQKTAQAESGLPSYAKPGPYKTDLSPDQEKQFQGWVKQNNVPWQDSPNADYDMRGYYKAMQSGDQNAQQGANGHYPDTYKTPYHKTFSNESKYATADAPHWDGNRLVDKSGNVIADETPKTPQPRPDFTQEALSGKLAPASRPDAPQEQSAPVAAIPRGRGDVSQAKGGYFPPTDIPIQGVKDIKEGIDGFTGLPVPITQVPAARGQMPRPVAPKPQLSPEDQELATQQENQRAASAAKIIQGAGEVGTVALPGALAAAPLSTVASLIAGTAASAGVGKAVHGHMSPEAEDLARQVAFFLPAVAGTAIGLEAGTAKIPGGKVAGARVLGGKAGIAVRSTPEAFEGALKVGDTRIGARIPRNGTPAPETPAPLSEGEQAMVQYEQNAGNIPKAPPPIPPPTPSQKAGLDNKLSGQAVDAIAQTIAKAKPKDQNALIEQAHQRMVQWIADNNGKVFVDGKIQIASNPAAVEGLAAKIINDASTAHDKATDLAAKEAEKTQATAEKQKTAKTTQPATPQATAKAAETPAKVEAQPKTEAVQTQPEAEKPTSQIAKVEESTSQNLTTNDVAKQEAAPKHDFASTQVNIDPKSELGQRHAEAVAAMPNDHIGPNGKEDTPHVTVRYGLKDDSSEAIAKIKEAASKIAPFEATVGKTGSFPATKEGDRPVIAHVDQNPELNALRSAVEGAGNFKEDTHGDYKPHVTLGYVKPEHVAKYAGGSHLEGGKVPVDHVTVSKRDGTSETIKLGGKQVPDLVAQHEATPDLVAEHEGRRTVDRGNDRREDIQQRKRVSELTPEERAKELLTSDAVDLPNKRAFEEKEQDQKAPAIAMSDADGLKAFNDKYGYEAGSSLLRAKAESLKEAGLDAYHDKGDEFLHRGESAGDLKAKLEQAREILRNKKFTVKDADGKTITLHGVDFSYGTGSDLATAEAGLKSHKSEREARGERARGELRGITETGSKAADHGGTEKVKLPEGIPAKGQAGEVATNKLTLTPKKFQYKLNTNEQGVTNLLAGQKWNPELAGVVSVWHDPADGKTYVVNGHHRVQLAKQSGVSKILVRHLNVDSASEARARGALQNIAEGRGTAVDAAKFFRERNITPADLEKHGISMGEATAENGLALSKLDPYIFDKVVSGELSQGRGIAIGKATDNPATQEAILKLISKAEKRGRKITDGMVSELARFASRAKETTTETGGLFGNSFRTENNALDKAEVSDYIRSQIVKEKRVFGAVSTEGKAEVLGQVKGQNIKAEQNQKIALEASQAGELYDKLSSSRGPIDDILENAAQRIAKRENSATVKADAYKQARTELRKALPGSEGPSTEGLQGRPAAGEETEREADRQASVKQTALQELRKSKTSSDEPSLPGMASHIEANKESAAATQGEDLSHKLTEQPKSVSSKTGEMERNSPLFRDSEASGQSGLFGAQSDSYFSDLANDTKSNELDRSVKGKKSERGFARGDLLTGIGKPDGSPKKTAPTFFSKAEKVASEKLPNSILARAVVPTLKSAGVKNEELKWLGLDEWLNGKARVTKQEVLDHIRQNNVQVKEVMKGNAEPLAWADYQAKGGNHVWTTNQGKLQYSVEQVGDKFHASADVNGPAGKLDERFGSLAAAQRWINEVRKENGAGTKFSNYQLPGGENYRELLLTLPEKSGGFDPSKVTFKRIRPSTTQASAEIYYDGKKLGTFDDPPMLNRDTGNYDTKTDAQLVDIARARYGGSREMGIKPLDEGKSFRGGHFDEPNVLAHIRFTDHITPDGKKALMLEEVQSDWHQFGRKVGYKGDPLDIKVREAEQKSAYGDRRQFEVEWPIAAGIQRTLVDRPDIKTIEEARTWVKDHASEFGVEHGRPPDAPFKNTWHELAMKRMLRYAAENGYDKLAWTTGEQQAQRYDLSKHIDSLKYDAPGGRREGQINISAEKGGQQVIPPGSYKPEELSNVVGKELADKIIAGINSGKTSGEFSGLDLKVGGQGMKGFYDKILPDFMNKYGKRWGAKVGTTEIPAGETVRVPEGQSDVPLRDRYTKEQRTEPVHSIPITPDMRDSVMHEGQPMYAHNPLSLAYVGAAKLAEMAGPPVANFIRETSAKTAEARSVDDKLFSLGKQYEADVLRAIQLMKQVGPLTTPVEQADIYHHLEDSKVPLSAKEQAFLDKIIKPMMQQSSEIRAKLNDAGVPMGEEGYVHRVVQRKSSQLERAMAKKKGTGKGNILSKAAASLKQRTMFALEDEEGNRVVISRKDGRITSHTEDGSEDLGTASNVKTQDAIDNARIDRLGKKISELKRQQSLLKTVKGRVIGNSTVHGVEPSFKQRAKLTDKIYNLEKQKESLESAPANSEKIFTDKDGKQWRFTQATTKEIEANTGLTYYKNATASAVTDYLQLLRAQRANDALESMKADPEFKELSFKSDNGQMPPDGWRAVNLPQFRNYYFEPHIAEVLDRFEKELHPDPPTVLEKIGNFMTSTLLLNPVRHIYNIGNHWLVERGASGTFNPLAWPTAARAGMKAIKAVVNQNDDFLSALDKGAPMMSHRTDLQELHQQLFQTIVGHLEKNPTVMHKIAEFSGYSPTGPEDKGIVSTAARATGLRMLNNLRKVGQKAMWQSNDMFMLQSSYEKMAKDSGLSFEDAMAQTAKHIPDYRIPTRILNSKAMADFMGSRLASMFGRYHYGVWKSYWEMAKEAAAPGATAKERLRGLDHLFMLGVLTFIGYKLWDEVLKKITHDNNAKMVRSGASAIPGGIEEVLKGDKPASTLIRGTFTPAIFPQTAAEILFNRDFFTGAKVYKDHTDTKKQAEEIGKHFVNSLGPVQQYNQAQRSGHPLKNALLGQVGVNTNHPKKHR